MNVSYLITVHNEIEELKRLIEILENACKFNAKSRQTKDFIEGISAFIDKRKPYWQNYK